MATFGDVDWRWSIMSLAIPTIVFYCLTLVGCTNSSPTLDDIFMLAVKNLNETKGSSDNFEIRIGYFGMCAGVPDGKHTCFATSGREHSAIMLSYNQTIDLPPDTLPPLKKVDEFFALAEKLQSRNFSPRFLLSVLAAAGVFFSISVLSLIFLIYRMRKNSSSPRSEDRRKVYRYFSVTPAWISVAFAVASAGAITQTVNALQFYGDQMDEKELVVGKGQTMLVLQWMIVAFSFLWTSGVTLLYRISGGKVVALGSGSPSGTEKGDSMESEIPPGPESLEPGSP